MLQKTDLMISYRCDKVRKENKQVYSKLSGNGVLIMEIVFFISAIYTASVSI